jgi:hypothetical protein
MRKPQSQQGFCFNFIIFKIKLYLKELLWMRGLYKRFKKLKTSKELTQMVSTNPDF